MKNAATILSFMFALLSVTQGCAPRKKPALDWSVTLDKDSKAPYGTNIAWRSLPAYFPGARIEQLSRNFRYTSLDNTMTYHGDSSALLVMIGLSYYISEQEWTKLKSFANTGNEILIVCNKLDSKISEALNCMPAGGYEEQPLSAFYDGSSNERTLSLNPDTAVRYGHRGRSLINYFELERIAPADSADATPKTEEQGISPGSGDQYTDVSIATNPDVLGYANDKPNFLRYRVGAGHVTIHIAPLALTNYFLLQSGNRKYLDGIWQAFPAHVSHIYWNEYYKRSSKGTDMGVLWRYPATRWALIISISTLLFYVLFGVKRRQRIVPVVKPLENASVSFVETIGRLYYNKGNHANLAEKMVQHFLDWVRSYYYMDTAILNDDFGKHLVSKSGQPQEKVNRLLQSIHDLRTNSVVVNEEYLYELHHLIQSFYDNNYN